jgi:ribosome-associated protein
MTKKSASKRAGSSLPPATKGKARVVPEEAPPEPTSQHGEGFDGAMRALALALEKKAQGPVLLDVRNLCSFCNYQLVVSGRSERQVDAIADGISVGLKADGLRPLGAEGARTGQWGLLDYGDFVVHVFLDSAREHYDLEGLWNDAPRVTLDVPADAHTHAGDPYASAPR